MENVFGFGGFRVDFARRQVFYNGTDVALTEKEFNALAALCRSGEQPMSKDELVRNVWSNEPASDAAITQTIYRLRCALRRFEPDANYIATVSGRGYQFRQTLARVETPPDWRISDIYQRAMLELGQRSYDSVRRSIELFDLVLNVEPNYIPALMGLAQAHIQASIIVSMKASPNARS